MQNFLSIQSQIIEFRVESQGTKRSMNTTCHTVGFYRASACLVMQSLILLLQICVSVSLSDCHTVVLYLNECIYRETFFTFSRGMPLVCGRYHR